MRSLLIFALAACLTTTAMADQSDPTFPVLELAPAAASEPSPAPAPGAKEAALRQLVDEARVGVEANVTPPPSDLTLRSGVNQIIPIARQHLNRFITPFEHPEVKTASTATAFFDNSILYVGTNDTQPVTLYLLDAAQPEMAMSLTLVPRDIPPVQVTLHLDGLKKTSIAEPVIAPQPELAAEWEVESEYSDTIVSILRALAKREIPQGYGLSTHVQEDGYAPTCGIPGTRVTLRQRLTGGAFIVYVARVDNISRMPLLLTDPECTGSQILGSAVWPSRELAAGSATELYLVMRRPTGPNLRAVRPSVLAGS